VSIIDGFRPKSWSLTYSSCTEKLGDGQLLQQISSWELGEHVAKVEDRPCKVRVQLACFHVVEDGTPQDPITPDAPQSDIRYRAIVQRDQKVQTISLDSLLLVTTLCSGIGEVGLELRGRNAIWWGLACDICILAYVPSQEYCCLCRCVPF
jgi:hypothetical protein